MTEQTEGQIVIEGSAAEIMDVLTDFEAYPEWADVKSAVVLERGEGGVGTKVAFEVEVPLLGKASYTLAYRYAPGDGGMSWSSRKLKTGRGRGVPGGGAAGGVAGAGPRA